MSKKANAVSVEAEEAAQTLAAKPEGEAVVASETQAPVVETAVEAKPAESKPRKSRKAAKTATVKKGNTKAKKADAAPKEEKKAERKKPGPKPMTAKQKADAAKERAENKRKAENMQPAIIVEYFGEQADANALVEQAKAAFHAEKKRTLITDLKLYVKPEERAAYYVINESYTGKISF